MLLPHGRGPGGKPREHDKIEVHRDLARPRTLHRAFPEGDAHAHDPLPAFLPVLRGVRIHDERILSNPPSGLAAPGRCSRRAPGDRGTQIRISQVA